MRFALACAFALLGLPGMVRATSVLMGHNTLASTGLNATETILTPANVNVSSFGMKFSTSVDGWVQAQPLYVPSVAVTGGAQAGTHDLVIVATQNDSLYAVDANSGVVIWQTSFLDSGLAGASSITAVPSGDVLSQDITPVVGICGTPVIDAVNGMLYVAAKTKQIVGSDSHYVYTLYEIDISNGNASQDANIVASTVIADTICDDPTDSPATYTFRTANDPTAVQDPFTAAATGDGAITVNGQSRVYFNALRELNRPGLVVSNGIVYLAFGSHGDNSPYHGWVLGYNVNTLALVTAFNDTPNGGQGGIWSCGTAIAVDGSGNLFIMSGNGTFDGNIVNGSVTGLTNGRPSNGDYGDSFIKLTPDSSTVSAQHVNGYGLSIGGYFSPYNNQTLSNADSDLGAGGCTVLPASAGSTAHPNLLVGAGKQGVIYLIDRDAMGGFGTTNNVVEQETFIDSFDTPAFFNGLLYYGLIQSKASAYTLSNAVLTDSPVQTPDTYTWPGATPSISSNGTSNGVAWFIERGTNELRAYNATNLTSELWTSAQASGSRDSLGVVTKFSVPTIADGHVMVGTTSALVVYGELGSQTVNPNPPVVATGLASAVVGSSATLSGTVNPEGTDTTFFFQYGTTSSYGSTSGSQDAGAGSSSRSLSEAIGSLSPSTTYYYRAVATSAGGAVYGTGKTFRTGAEQALVNSPNTYLSATGAEVAYSVNTGGLSTTAYIQYGTDTSYGSQTATVTIGAGASTANLLAQLSDLYAGTTYHYQIVTHSSAGTVSSSDQTFTTLPFDTTQVAVHGDVPEALSGTTFASFGHPIINENGYCAYRAVLMVGSGVTAANNVAIFADDDSGTSQVVARTGVTVAPGMSPSTFAILDDPVYNNNQAVAFVGTAHAIADGATASTNVGVWSTSSGSLQLVAREGSQAPDLPSGVTFAGFNEIALPDANGPIILAHLRPDAAAGIGTSNALGIWATDSSGNLHKVVETGDTLDGKKVTALSFMASTPPVAGTTRAFVPASADMTYSVTFSDHTTAIFDATFPITNMEVVASDTAAPGAGGANFASFGSPVISAGAHNAFRAVLNGTGVTSADNAGIWADDAAKTLGLVARTDSAAPGTTSTFATLDDPAYNDNFAVAFIGTLHVGTGLAAATNNAGIWSSTSGSLEPVIRTGSQAPGCPVGATFASFSQIALPDDNGVMFLGHLAANAAAKVSAGNSLGIWASDPSGNLQLIVRTGDILNGKTVLSVSFMPAIAPVIGQSRSASQNGNIIYMVTYTDHTTAILSVVFP